MTAPERATRRPLADYDRELAPDVRSVTFIRPPQGWAPLNFRELWEYHELLYFLVWRDIKIRYKQTVLGAAWAVIQPFFTMIVFSLFFGHLAKMSSDGVPYPIFNYTALVPWMFFANGLTQASNRLVSNVNLIKKVYFPRLLIPLAAALSGVVDFVLAFVVLLGMMFYYGIVPTSHVFWLFLFLLLAFVTAVGVGLWLSAMNAQFRDIQYTLPFLIQFWFFSTPIAYSSSLVPEPWRPLYGLNPMVGVIEGFRWALLGTATAPGAMVVASAFTALLLLITGAFYYRRLE